MKIYELIRETLFRKTYIRVVHIAWLAVYGLLFLIPFPREVWRAWPWGPMVFAWSGCFLPLLLSAGIIGDDLASGRIGLLVTRPIWPGELYLYRLAGLSLQALVHLVIAGLMIFILLTITSRGAGANVDELVAEFKDAGLIGDKTNVQNLALWILSAWLIFNSWAALSTTLSTVVKRAHNSMLLFAALGFAYLLVMIMISLFPKHAATEALMGLLRYAAPPVELLGNLAMGKYNVLKSLGCVMHSFALVAVYSAVGIVILSRRQFVCARD
jgi:ABC-type transport system involved in multi-copper enzyme maturation permease subunit